jgi:hypothetical protein
MKRSFGNPLILTILISTNLIAFTSCKKYDSTGNNTEKLRVYIETLYQGNISSWIRNTDTFQLSYDANDRLISAVSQPGGNNAQYHCTYNGSSSIIIDLIYAGGAIQKKWVQYLNTNGLIDSSLFIGPYAGGSGSPDDTVLFRYTYNVLNDLVEQNDYIYSTTGGYFLYKKIQYTYDAAGNVVAMDEFDPAGMLFRSEYWTYTNYPYRMILPMESNWPHPKMINLPSGHSYNGVYYHSETYTFDNQNRLSTAITSGGDSMVRKYSYW